MPDKSATKPCSCKCQLLCIKSGDNICKITCKTVDDDVHFNRELLKRFQYIKKILLEVAK